MAAVLGGLFVPGSLTCDHSVFGACLACGRYVIGVASICVQHVVVCDRDWSFWIDSERCAVCT